MHLQILAMIAPAAFVLGVLPAAPARAQAAAAEDDDARDGPAVRGRRIRSVRQGVAIADSISPRRRCTGSGRRPRVGAGLGRIRRRDEDAADGRERGGAADVAARDRRGRGVRAGGVRHAGGGAAQRGGAAARSSSRRTTDSTSVSRPRTARTGSSARKGSSRGRRRSACTASATCWSATSPTARTARATTTKPSCGRRRCAASASTSTSASTGSCASRCGRRTRAATRRSNTGSARWSAYGIGPVALTVAAGVGGVRMARLESGLVALGGLGFMF